MIPMDTDDEVAMAFAIALAGRFKIATSRQTTTAAPSVSLISSGSHLASHNSKTHWRKGTDTKLPPDWKRPTGWKNASRREGVKGSSSN